MSAIPTNKIISQTKEISSQNLVQQRILQRSNSSYLKESDFKTPLIHKNFGAGKIVKTLEKYKSIQPSAISFQQKYPPNSVLADQQSNQSQIQPQQPHKRTLSYYGNLLTEGRPLKLSDYTDMDCILEPEANGIGGVYLGNINGAKDLRMLRQKKLNQQQQQYNRIGAVLTVMMNSGISYKNKDISQMIFNVDDADYVNLQQYFDRAVKFIDQNRKNTNVFVHCYAGISRSASIIIAYIMHNQRLNFNDAFQFVKKRRKIISPNCGFQRQLKQYEFAVKEQNSLKKEFQLKSNN